MPPDLTTVIEDAECLLDLIERQREALGARDPETVGRLAADMAPLIERLEQAAPLLERHAGSGDDPSRHRLRAVLDTCRRLNALNGNRIEAISRHTRRALSLLCADPGASPLYGPRGDEQPTRLSRYAARA